VSGISIPDTFFVFLPVNTYLILKFIRKVSMVINLLIEVNRLMPFKKVVLMVFYKYKIKKMSGRSDAFFKEATKDLEVAKEELLKPAEDIVSYSVCKNSQFAIENYLKGFLIKNNVDFDVNANIATLFDNCVSVEPRFSSLDLDAVACKNHTIDSRCCSEIDAVTACFDVADEIDTFLQKRALL